MAPSSKSPAPSSLSAPFPYASPPHVLHHRLHLLDSPSSSDGLAWVLFSKNSAHTLGSTSFDLFVNDLRLLGVEFDSSMDENAGDINGNHVGIYLGIFVSVSASNVSSMNLMLNSGEKLRSFIDYDPFTRRIEVRLSRFRDPRPYYPLVAYFIDLSKMRNAEEDVAIGLSSASRNSVQTSSIYSWSFHPRKDFKSMMHSMSADPNVAKKTEHLEASKRKKMPY